jgi:hypothetical protein
MSPHNHHPQSQDHMLRREASVSDLKAGHISPSITLRMVRACNWLGGTKNACIVLRDMCPNSVINSSHESNKPHDWCRGMG